MNLETKYAIGDKVIVKADLKIKEICPFCQGKGYMYLGQQKLYCQNCDDGHIIVRSNERVEAEGIITGLTYEIRTETDDVYDDFVKMEDNISHQIEYYVDVDSDKYYGNGTYKEKQILRKV